MKKLIITLISLVLAMLISSCVEIPDRGDYCTEDAMGESKAPESTSLQSDETGFCVCVDWMDFVRINGVVYDGGFENKTVPKSRVGERIGRIEYRVGTRFSSQAELDEASRKDFASYLRPVGCEIFAVKDEEGSIAVLDGDKYYLYTAAD